MGSMFGKGLREKGLRVVTVCVVASWALIQTAIASPTELSGWQDWLRDKHPDSRCPWQATSKPEHLCIWPGQLQLTLTAKGMDFNYRVDVFNEQLKIPLPGDANHWPLNVKANQRAVGVVESGGKPYLSLSRGRHLISGQFQWQRQPASLTTPTEIALVQLQQDNKSLPIDRRGNQILLNTKADTTTTEERDTLTVESFRLLQDSIPLAIQTIIRVSVSGKPREIVLGRAALAGTEVMQLDSPLPARIEADGNLRIQVTAGEHTVNLYSRFLENVSEIKTQPQTDNWPKVEYLSFASDTGLRQLKLSGATSIDTSQIDLPEDWEEYPTYRLDPDQTLTLETVYRGDHAPLANQLSVVRNLWLDFSGNGITAKEEVSGRMYRDWRLNTQPDTHLGRAMVDNQPVLITRAEDQQGVEIRSPNIDLAAVSRIDNPANFTASGWQASVDNFSATLHLPPGWRVFHASGIDHINGTWISQWNLWAIFFLLIMIAVTHKLLGLPAAIVAGFCLVVTYHEHNAPILLLPPLLLFIALLTVLKGAWQQAVSILAVAVSAVLVISLLGFAVSYFRLALYPSLEQYQVGRYEEGQAYAPRSLSTMADMAAPQAEFKKNARLEEVLVTAQKADRDGETIEMDDYQIDENDRIQTGPGLPDWTWNSVQLSATGPVDAEQKLRVFYSPPWLTSLWRIFSVILLVGFSGLLIRRLAQQVRFTTANKAPDNSDNKQTPSIDLQLGVVITALMLGGLSLGSQPVAAADYPPQYLLEDLQDRLLKAPECLPDCAAINQADIRTAQQDLSLTLKVYVDADIALPLPTSRQGWQISQVLVDGNNEPVLSQQNGQLLVQLQPGHHQITLRGSVVGDQAAINLPLALHNVNVDSQDWLVEGVIDGRIPSRTLTLHSKLKQAQQQDSLVAEPIKPFVEVTRQFAFGNRWRIVTRVERVAPEQGPLSVNIALLPFEKVLDEKLNIVDGVARLRFGPTQRIVRWESTVEPMGNMALTASTATDQIETWSFYPSSQWHIKYSGIPAIKSDDDNSTLHPTFKPWPGESLQLSLARPEGVPGPTYTVENAQLTVTAGSRQQKAELSMEIRSSIGSDYNFTLPPGSEVTSLLVNGRALNLPSDHNITIPLQPGMQSLQLNFQQPRPMGWQDSSPQLNLPGNVTNLRIDYQLPRDRWSLFLNGPAIGPSMLYWGVLCVILLAALGLNWLARRLQLQMPIGLVGWLLLGIGLSTINQYGVVIIALFFFVTAWRQQRVNAETLRHDAFNGLQAGFAVLTVIATLTLIAAIPFGLLSDPNMQVVGNGSSSHYYRFYQDRISAGDFPQVTVISSSIFIYRLVMLAWALWLATRLITWAQWWWQAFSAQRLWNGGVKVKQEPPAP